MAETNTINQNATRIWKRLYGQYLLGYALQCVSLFGAVWLFSAILFQIASIPNAMYAGAFCGLGAGLFWFFQNRSKFTEQALVNRLNHQYEWLEYSTQLLHETPADTLPLLQKQRVEQILIERQQNLSAWPDIRKAILFFVAAGIAYAAFSFWSPKHSETASANISESELPKIAPALVEKLPTIKSLQVRVQPPAYTHLASWNAKEISLEAPEQSQIQWKCQLDKTADVFQIIWNGKDTSQIRSTDAATYTWQKALTTSTFYQIRYGLKDDWFLSPVYTLHAIDDQAPVITVQKPGPYTLVLYGVKPEIQTQLTLTDDYGLAQARLVATVSRGSGESVKFREVQLPFAEAISGKKTIQLGKRLDFLNLKMEPGDELYFYAETWDQANPVQKSRSDTYFVQWEDTTSQKTSVMAGISLDNMPAYFRSQRQIIIDTEKLIAEKKGLTANAFKERSNELGVDQKVLRLRYGQFLGEEFETNIGGEHEHHEEGEEHEEDAHEKTLEQLHDHGKESQNPAVFGQLGDMLNGYEHRHDAGEIATFFDETMKAQLKAALAQMWESELRLRTMRPEEALPYEYKALELIKNLQQKSRVYVERVGFKPPPLKPAEKRLTGELDEVKGSKRTWDAPALENAYPHLRQAISVLEKFHNRTGYKPTAAERQTLEKASGELAAIILQQPGIRATTLNELRQLLSGQTLTANQIAQIQRQFVRLLPAESAKPGATAQTREPELNLFIDKLNR